MPLSTVVINRGPTGPTGPKGAAGEVQGDGTGITDADAFLSNLGVEIRLQPGTANASANVTALQSALDAKGRIYVTGPLGDVYIDATVYYDDDTDITFDSRITLCRTGAFGEMLLNKSALVYGAVDANIIIRGLRLDPKGIGTRNANVLGMNCHLGAFRVNNLRIEDFHIENGGNTLFSLQVCDFDGLSIIRPHIDSPKDGIHIGAGENYLIDEPYTRTSDDAIALNAMDWIVSQPSFGNGYLRGGQIRRWRDQGVNNAAAHTLRVVQGAWGAWSDISGATVQRGSTFRGSNGWVYRANLTSGATATATDEPTHTGWQPLGNIVTGADGIPWIAWQQAGFDAVTIENCQILGLLTDQKDGDNGRARMIRFNGDADGTNLEAIFPGMESKTHIRGIVIDGWDHVAARAATPLASSAVVTDLTIRNARFQGVNPTNFLSVSGFEHGGAAFTERMEVLLDNVFIDYDPGSFVRVNRDGLDVDVTVRGGDIGDNPNLTETAGSVSVWRDDRDLPLYLADHVNSLWESGWFSEANSGTASAASTQDGEIRIDSGTALSGYAKAFTGGWIKGFSEFSGSAFDISTAGHIAFACALNATTSASTAKFRLLVGVEASRTPATSDADALSALGFGFEVRRNNGPWEARMVSHDGATETTGSWIQIDFTKPTSLRAFRLAWDGEGGVYLYVSASGGSKGTLPIARTYIDSITGFGSSNLPGRYIGIEVANPASGTADNLRVVARKSQIHQKWA